MTDFKFGSCFNIYFFYLQCNVTSLGPAATVIPGHISQSGDPVEQIAQLVNIEVGHHPPLLGILARLPAPGLGQAVHARAHQQRLQVAVLAEQNVRVGSVDTNTVRIHNVMHRMHTKSHLSPIMSVRAGTMPGCLRATISNMNLLGLPSTTGCRPAAVATAATMEPVPGTGGGSENK